MFREVISPILRSTDCAYSLWYNAPTRQHRPWIIPQVVNTVCAPEDGRNYHPKHFELIGIINKPLLLHLVGCLYNLSIIHVGTLINV